MTITETPASKRVPPKLRPFTVAHFRRWAKDHILDNEEPWILEDHQERFAVDLFEGFLNNWYLVPEANGKTTFLAGISLYLIEHKDGIIIPVAAASKEQAQVLYQQAEGMVYRSEREKTFKCLEGFRRIRFDKTRSRIQIFAADAKTGDGIIPGGIVVIDELHRHRNLDLYRTWSGKIIKRRAQLIVISTAGEVGSEFEQERLHLKTAGAVVEREGRCYTRAVRHVDGRPLSVIHEYAVPEDGDLEDLELVKEANPFSGITVEDLREKRAMTSAVAHWSRFSCNRAARSESAAITEAEWFGAVTKEPIPEGEPIWLGIDLGWRWDTTVLVPFWMPSLEHRQFGPATVIEPPRYEGRSLELHDILRPIARIHERNPIHTVVMDISDGRDVAEWIETELGARVVERGTSNPASTTDYANFMRALRNGVLFHAGDIGLTKHALNAIARVLPQGEALFKRPVESRLAKQDTRVIDALVAAAMVHTVAIENSAGSVYDERGVVAV